MKTIVYNKLVRDKIPQIIRTQGNTCVTQTLSDEEYLSKLDQKLGEELGEYLQDHSMEELADLLEVLYACAMARGYSLNELEQVRAEKAASRGGFQQRILLKEVREL